MMSQEIPNLRRFLARFMLCYKQKTIIFLKCRNRKFMIFFAEAVYRIVDLYLNFT